MEQRPIGAKSLGVRLPGSAKLGHVTRSALSRIDPDQARLTAVNRTFGCLNSSAPLAMASASLGDNGAARGAEDSFGNAPKYARSEVCSNLRAHDDHGCMAFGG
jgi:hypothetical protein